MFASPESIIDKALVLPQQDTPNGKTDCVSIARMLTSVEKMMILKRRKKKLLRKRNIANLKEKKTRKREETKQKAEESEKAAERALNRTHTTKKQRPVRHTTTKKAKLNNENVNGGMG